MEECLARVLKKGWVLLLVGTLAVACSSEKPGAPEAKAKAAVSGKSHTEAAPGQPHAEGEAPHGHAGGSGPAAGSGPAVTLTATERANIGLKTALVEERPFEDVRTFPGVIKALPDRVAAVTSRTAGKVITIHAALGERVKKGDDLLEVQSVEVEKLELDLLQAESRARTELLKLEIDLKQAQNKLQLADADVRRNQALVDKGIGARKELIAAENQLQAVQNEIAGLGRQRDLVRAVSQSEVEGLTRQLMLLGVPPADVERLRQARVVTTLHIAAPLDGIVVERPVVLGQVVEPTTTLMKLADTSVVVAQGSVPEDLLSQIRLGQPVRVTVPAYPGQLFEGRVTFIHPQIDPERRVAQVWAEVRNRGQELKEEMYVRLSVVLKTQAKAVVVPLAALMNAEGREFVFVETPGGFKRVDVLVGPRNDQYVEVKQGLTPGAKVVTDGKRQVYTVFLTARSGGPALGGHH